MKSPALALAALFMAAVSIASGQETGSVTGRVIDDDDDPLRGAVVKVLGTSPARGHISREDGSFIINNLPPGFYHIQFSAYRGESPVIKAVEIRGGDTVDLGVTALTIIEPSVETCVCNPADIVHPERTGTIRKIGFAPQPWTKFYDIYYR